MLPSLPVLVFLAMATASAAEVDPRAAAAAIDRLVDEAAAERHATPTPPLDDDHFLRCVYLDTIGRIPTRDEGAAFADDHSAERRRTLVHRLLASEGRVCHEFSWWADLLRVQTRLMSAFAGDVYIDWIKGAIRDDLPYDHLVKALITADGSLLERGNGAVGFYVRDANMLQDNMSNTVQVFLGTRLACAQCHNHPFDRWTRNDYMRMVAYTNGVAAQAADATITRIRAIAPADATPADKQAIRAFADSIAVGVHGAGKGLMNLPKDYQYDDAKPNAQVWGRSIFGNDAPVFTGCDARASYAAWMTSEDNPRFTLVIANRLWKKVMGLGLIEPVDNLTDASVATAPKLMEHLVQLMKDLRYDLRAFEEVLFDTDAYQRQATAIDISAGETPFVPGPVLRRMTAEEMWDSLLCLVVPDLDQRRLANPEAIYAYYDALKAKSPEQTMTLIQAVAQNAADRNTVAQRIKELQMAAESPQALRQLPEFQELQRRQKELNDARQALSYDAASPQIPENDPRWKDFRRDLVRAADLPTPAAPGHLLREFGQSDRLLIDNGNDHASIPQALSLLNGFIDQEVLKPHSVVMKVLAESQDPAEKIRLAFRCVLSRAASEAECERLAPLFADAKTVGKAMGDLVWALVNSDEFRFVP